MESSINQASRRASVVLVPLQKVALADRQSLTPPPEGSFSFPKIGAAPENSGFRLTVQVKKRFERTVAHWLAAQYLCIVARDSPLSFLERCDIVPELVPAQAEKSLKLVALNVKPSRIIRQIQMDAV